MKAELDLIILIAFGLIVVGNCKVVINLRIYSYGNENDAKADGVKCETFHWANDYCDPMFHICVTSPSNSRCNILDRTIDHWRNKKFISTVLQHKIKLNNVKRSLQVDVKIDDHDKLDGHDHIARFSAKFELAQMNHNYEQAMTVNPSGLSVILSASMRMQCEENYFGKDCDTFCKPLMFNYDCNTSSGDRICVLKCGLNGVCDWDVTSATFMCKCKSGRSGDQCEFSSYERCSTFRCDLECTYSQLYKYCTCKPNKDSRICQEILNISTSGKMLTSTYTSSKLQFITTPELQTSSQTKRLSSTIDTKDSIPIHNQIKEVYQGSFSAATIATMCMLIILCICVLSLLIVIRKWRKKDKINKNGFSLPTFRSHMPLPPVVYRTGTYGNRNGIESSLMNGTRSDHPISIYDQCTVDSDCVYEAPLIKFDVDNGKDSIDTCEHPIFDNNDSMTCGTTLDSKDDDSITYEIPRQST